MIVRDDVTPFSTLARRATEDGNAPFAFFSNSPPLTAAELLADAGRVAAALADCGVTAGSRVMLLGITCRELLAALMGSWQLGALVCPVEAFLAPAGMRKVIEQFRCGGRDRRYDTRNGGAIRRLVWRTWRSGAAA